MKSPHLLSTVHDLAICTRSVQSSQKRRFHHYDSDCCLNNTWPSFHTDRVDRAAVSPTTLADLAPAAHTSSASVCRFLACKLQQFHQRLCRFLACKLHQFHQRLQVSRFCNHTSSIRIPRSSPDLGYPAWCSSSFHLTSPRSSLVGLLLLTAVI